MKNLIHKPLVQGVIFALDQTFNEQRYSDKVLESLFKQNRQWGARDRRFVAEATYDIVRWWRLLSTVARIEVYPLQEKDFYKIFVAWMTKKKMEIPEWLKGQSKNLALNQFDNTVRSISESIPDWLDEEAYNQLGESWAEILHPLNQTAPVFLRANLLKINARALSEELKKEGIETQPFGDETLKLKFRKNVFTTKAFQKGLFEVQDIGSQKIAKLLNPASGDRIVDACAGAGGKTLHMAALMKNKGKIIALDIHEWKLNELKKRTRRAGVDIVETKVISSQKIIKRMHESCDKLLLDVPCSGLGVLRRNPDTKWKLTKERLTELESLQSEILDSYSRMVRPGGSLVYATCSILPTENEKQVEGFVQRQESLWGVEEQIHIRPGNSDSDGFYAARLRRK